MKTIAVICCFGMLLLGGCPTPQPDNSSAVTAEIAASSTAGAAPFTIALSAAASTSRNGGPLTYTWDFADGASSDQVEVGHTFELPGRYVVRLQVTDSTGQQGLADVIIRAAGTSATAVIGAEPTAGTAPLVVQFDGTASVVPDDTILDYYWDFGDGGTSRDSKPMHIFSTDGQFTVSLRIITAGGLEATATTAITVGQPVVSLQFNGTSFATLPLGGTQNLTAFTFETWVKADNDGGTVASLGSGVLTLDVQPATNTIRFVINGTATSTPAANLSGVWRHLAITYDAGAGTACILYLDGAPVANTPVSAALAIDRITLGAGLRGKIAEVRLWTVVRTSTEILATKDQHLTGHESGLFGYWPLSEGSGQILHNLASPTTTGTLGATTLSEAADPTWSTDGPPVD